MAQNYSSKLKKVPYDHTKIFLNTKRIVAGLAQSSKEKVPYDHTKSCIFYHTNECCRIIASRSRLLCSKLKKVPYDHTKIFLNTKRIVAGLAQSSKEKVPYDHTKSCIFYHTNECCRIIASRSRLLL